MNSIIKKLNTNCNKCNILINKNNIVKNRKGCKSCLHKMTNKQVITPHQYLSNNHEIKTNRYIIVGSSGAGKTNLMLDLLKNINPNNVDIICRSKNQYPDKYPNQSLEIEDVEFYENSHIVFDELLGSKQSRDIDQFFTRSRHNIINVYYITQSWYAIPKNTIRINTSIIYISTNETRYSVFV